MDKLGMRCYGVYNFSKYPEWDVVVTTFGQFEKRDGSTQDYFEGYAFDKEGNFETNVMLNLPIEFTEIGYIYKGGQTHKLTLSLIEKEDEPKNPLMNFKKYRFLD